MSRATPQTREFARRLIAYEAKGNKASERKDPAAFYICEKLRPQLSTLMGSAGFHALLSRALAVAAAKDAWLRKAHVEADGSLGGWDELSAPADPEEMTESSVVLVAQLFGLLAVLIGEELTLRLAREVWPKLPRNNFRFW